MTICCVFDVDQTVIHLFRNADGVTELEESRSRSRSGEGRNASPQPREIRARVVGMGLGAMSRGREHEPLSHVALILRKETASVAAMDGSPDDPRLAVLLNTLRQCRLFADMAPHDLASIAKTCETRKLGKGETLFREREKARGFYIVQHGAINIHRLSADGKEQVIAIFRPYECFAEVTLTTIETYPANAVALEPSQVVLVRKGDFRALIMRTPELALRMLTSMSFHLKHLVQVMEDQKFKRIESRLANHLLRNVPSTGTSGDIVVSLDTSKKVLAGRLGVSSETLSRSLARFRREKLISVHRAKITIHDSEGLRAYLEE